VKPCVPLFIAVLALAPAACGLPEVAGQGETVIVTLPSADAHAGRQAFVDLKCTACHRVASEPTFPAPVSANPGPVLDASLAGRDFSYLTTAIVSPSHRISQDTDPEVRVHMEGTLSPMADYSRSMTVRQLADLHAYLQSLARQ
jgi:hypothetical protein